MKIDYTDCFHICNGHGYQITHLGRGKWVAEIRQWRAYGSFGKAIVYKATNKSAIGAMVRLHFKLRS